MLDTNNLSIALTERFGFSVISKATSERDGFKLTIEPAEISKSISFTINLHLGWRSIFATFTLGNYASGLVKSIKLANKRQINTFMIFFKSIISKDAELSVYLDEQKIKKIEPEIFKKDWKSIKISMRKMGLIVEKSRGYDLDIILPWAASFLGLVMSILPLEEEEHLIGEMEGEQKIQIVKRYERNRWNRAICIEIHGTKCKICSFDFTSTFGELGEGFIHIHHIVPLSEMNRAYVVDPRKDLIPICPNCHAMIHRKSPALSPEDLKKIMNM